MKKLLILLTLTLSVLCSQAQAASSEELVTQLRSFSSADLEADVQLVKEKKVSDLHIDRMFTALKEANKLIVDEKHLGDVELVKEMERVSLLTFKHDPSEYAAELIVPSYQKDKATFKKAAKSLPKAEAKHILDSLRNTERAVEGLDG